MGENQLYPDLTKLAENSTPDSSFRITQIIEIKKYFENEIETRRGLYNKYKKALNAFTSANHAFATISVGTAAASISTIAGLITAPVGMVLGGISLASAFLGGISSYVNKKLILTKLLKHEKILIVAISKMNTINDLISKSILDNNISDDEFKLILTEKEKYIGLRNQARNGARQQSVKGVSVSEIKKNLEKEVRSEIMERINQVSLKTDK